jgi:hypothetical protein
MQLEDFFGCKKSINFARLKRKGKKINNHNKKQKKQNKNAQNAHY